MNDARITLSCGCKSSNFGYLCEWLEYDTENKPCTAFGSLCKDCICMYNASVIEESNKGDNHES